MIQKIIKEGYWVCLSLILCTAPFFTNLNSYVIAIFGLFWLLNRPNFNWKKQNLTLFLFAVGYYLCQVYGVVISSVPGDSLFALEKKAGLLILPFFIITGPSISLKKLNNVLQYFLAVMLLSIVVFIVNASYELWVNGNNTFYYHSLSQNFGVHAMYYSYALALALYFSLNQFLDQNRGKKLGFGLSSLLIFSALTLLSSKMLLPVIIITLLWKLYQNLKSNKTFLIYSLIAITSITLLFGAGFSDRINEISTFSVKEFKTTGFKYDTEFNGLNLRFVLWSISYDILKNNNAFISGVGVGETEKLLNLEFEKRGLYTGNPNFKDVGYLGYNPHSQYIQEWLMNGILGLFFLCAMLLVALRLARTAPDYLFFFLLLTISFCITESVLQRQAGSVLFATVFGILIRIRSTNSELKRDEH